MQVAHAGMYIRMEKWPAAVGMLLRFAAACDASHAQASQCKAYLGAVVVWLYAGSGHQAWAVYQVSPSLSANHPCSLTLNPKLVPWAVYQVSPSLGPRSFSPAWNESTLHLLATSNNKIGDAFLPRNSLEGPDRCVPP